MKLLASVRNLPEARLVAKAGADIIDLKEPIRGSLGAVSWQEANRVSSQLEPPRPLSIALGELADFRPADMLERIRLERFQFAKIGLAGCRRLPDWRQQWQRWARLIAGKTLPVVVAYADHRECHAPDLSNVVELAIEWQAQVFLLDTCLKDGRCLFDHYPVTQLQQRLQPLRSHPIHIAIAGCLGPHVIDQIGALQPDIVAVRGALCDHGNRSAGVCERQTRAFKKLLRNAPPVAGGGTELR